MILGCWNVPVLIGMDRPVTVWIARTVEFREFVLRQLDVASKHRVVHHDASTLPLHGSGVDLVLVSHMRVLRAPLLKGPVAAQNGTFKWLLACMRPDVVLESAERHAAPPAVVALMHSFAGAL